MVTAAIDASDRMPLPSALGNATMLPSGPRRFSSWSTPTQDPSGRLSGSARMLRVW